MNDAVWRRQERARAAALRRARFDDLGLRRAISDRMLPLLVAAMAFLGALALAGAMGAAALARHWQQGAGAQVTVQVPRPADAAETKDGSRIDRVSTALAAAPGLAEARRLSDDELNDLLRPWLGAGDERLSLPLPAVIRVRLSGTGAGTATGADLTVLGAKLAAVAPGTLVEEHGAWIGRLATLARSLQACASVALLVVVSVAVAVVAVATRAGLVARRESIEIVHGLGATDDYIAARFAARATLLAGIGGVLGALAALPVLLGLAGLAAPFLDPAAGGAEAPLRFGTLPPLLWLALPTLPAGAAAIGYLTAQTTVRTWLRRLP